MSLLEAESLLFHFGSRCIADRVSMTLAPGKLHVLAGPNGSGKSTLLNLLSGLLTPESGRVMLDGKPLSACSATERADHIAVMSQTPPPALDFTVEERIAMGAFPGINSWNNVTAQSRNATEKAIRTADLETVRERSCNQLSGGEYQRTLFAAAIARKSRIILLDEPTSALDPAHRIMIMEALKELKKERAILMITHDIQLAAEYADLLWLFREGKILYSGDPAEVLTAENLRQVYGCETEILRTSSGTPAVIFRSR